MVPSVAFLLIVGSVSLAGCLDTGTGLSGGSSEVGLTFEGLQPLSDGLNYQAWAVECAGSGCQAYPFLLFNVDEDGQLLDPVEDTVISGPFPAGLDADDMYGIAVSIEATESEFSYDSYTYILGGEFQNGEADLVVENWMGIDADFSNAAGSYVLGTPTDEDDSNELAGIWFLDNTGIGSASGLNLPEDLPGWEYEGWVVIGEDTLSTGRFSSMSGNDDSDSYSGAGNPPEYPGEDFLVDPPAGVTFPPSLPGSPVFVTLEPVEGWDPEAGSPFFVRILEAIIPISAVPDEMYDLQALVQELPSGTATVW